MFENEEITIFESPFDQKQMMNGIVKVTINVREIIVILQVIICKEMNILIGSDIS